MHIGIFDSGIGGEAIATALSEYFPEARLSVISDRDNMPYGNKSLPEVRKLVEKAIAPLLAYDVDCIVLACNTATAAAIEYLRAKYPEQVFIGLEPMIKPAAKLSKTGVIAVCATPATLSSDSYKRLKQSRVQSLKIIEPDCSQWAYLIESNRVNEITIQSIVNDVIRQDADVIVLGCTHYHWIKEQITEAARGQAVVLEPSEAIGRRIKHVLKL